MKERSTLAFDKDKDKEHLNNYVCLEQEAREIYELFTDSLRDMEEKLKKCVCKTSEKVRVDSDEKSISVASKKE